MNQPLPSDPEDTIDLQDLFLTLAENIRLLVLGPLLVGAMTFGIAHVVPQKYESSAILQAEAPIAAYMTTPVVLDASMQQLGLLNGLSAQEAEEARTLLRSHISAQIGRNDKLITLTVTAGSPQAAQSLARTILENTFRESRPRANELKKLQEEEVFLQQQAKELGASSDTLQKAILQGGSGQDLSKLIESRSKLSENLIKIQEGIHGIQGKIDGVTAAAVLQSPTLPVRPVSPRKNLLAVLSAVAASFFLLIFAFLRQAWSSSDHTERQQQRWQNLRRKYGLRP